jgi:ABC-type glycerol-3-phosphate transport system substrate-binding protein
VGSPRIACLALILASIFAPLLGACDRAPAPPPPIRFLHTFGAEETELFNAAMAERGIAVDPSLVPFARGHQVIGELLRAGVDCPDLIRIDATWLLAFVAADLLLPVPEALARLDWTPEAAALGGGHAVPQTVDGLVVVRDRARPAPAGDAPAGIAELTAAARAARTPASPYPLGVRVDGYWFVPWLRAEGGELSPGGIDGDGAARALRAFAALFGEVTPRPPPSGSEAPDELRRWQAHELAYWVTGPWQIGALPDRDRLAVSALARAPRGGQLLVVPRCSRRPDDGWRLARELTEVAVAVKFAQGFSTVPTREAALAQAPPLVAALYRALEAAEPLPRDPLTPLLFDDLNPALAAVVSHDATAEEAIAGVRRGWKRLARAAPPAGGPP